MSRGRVITSLCGEIRVRGNAFQLVEKYSELAREASIRREESSAENFRQHAEHYQRVINHAED
jgi:hypothetical protein